MSFLGLELLRKIDAIESDTARWDPVVGGQLGRRVELLKDAVNAAVVAEEEEIVKRVAGAPLSETKRRDFADAQLPGFVGHSPLREQLNRRGALETLVTENAFAGGRESFLLAKRLFIDFAEFYLGDETEFGCLLAEEAQTAVFDALRELATPGPSAPDPVTAAVLAIDAMRVRGTEPDVVIILPTFNARTVLATQTVR